MNTTLLIQQITVAVVVSAVVVPTVQRIKGWFPSATWVETFSAIIAILLGILMARYYAGYDWAASSWVGFYSLIGAEAIYRLVSEKMTTFQDKKGIWPVAEADPVELESLYNEEGKAPNGENQ